LLQPKWVTQNRRTCWLVCCVTAAQCHKLFFHWAAKNSHWAAFVPPSYNAKRGYGSAKDGLGDAYGF